MRALVAVAATAGFALVATPLAAAKAPSAVTGAATSVGATTAVVTGKVDPGGEATSWYVEYGTTTGYGSRTDARSAGNGTAPVDVSEQLRGLTTGATYHYRLVATNASGARRRRDAHDPCRTGRRHGVGERTRADLRNGRRDGRSQRQLHGLVDRVRH